MRIKKRDFPIVVEKDGKSIIVGHVGSPTGKIIDTSD